MKKWLFILALLYFTPIQLLRADSITLYRIAFYNVENLFDSSDDSLKNDDAFTPTGFNHWTYKKMVRKINNIAKVILRLGEGVPPALVALAEVENDYVLKRLCKQSPLQKYGYEFVHYDSPDKRGIEVALLYRSEQVRLMHSEAIPIVFPFDTSAKNRDILYAVVDCNARDTLHLFVNHWTSRYSGYAATIPKRNYYAAVVKRKSDSLLLRNPRANIVITGDFNDYPYDESIAEILQAGPPDAKDGVGRLYNLMLPFLSRPNMGSHKREDFWGCLDQMMVSRHLLDLHNRFHVKEGEAHILTADFLLEHDEKYGGQKVVRTYLGPRYIGGYSDHLPVYIDLIQRW